MVEEKDRQDLLVLYHYGELVPAEQARIEALLAREPKVRDEYDRLRRDLALIDVEIDRAAKTDAPGDLESRLRRRLAPHLAQDARGEAAATVASHGEVTRSEDHVVVPLRTSLVRQRSAGAGAALAWMALAASVLVFVAGVAFEAGRHSVEPAPFAAARTWGSRERVLLAEVERHLGASERLLVDMSNSAGLAADAASMSDPSRLAEQDWARTLLIANRLYRFAATRSGQTRIAELLGDLEPILIELANGTYGDSPQYAAALRDSIQNGELLFRVRAERRGALLPHRPPRSGADLVTEETT